MLNSSHHFEETQIEAAALNFFGENDFYSGFGFPKDVIPSLACRLSCYLVEFSLNWLHFIFTNAASSDHQSQLCSCADGDKSIPAMIKTTHLRWLLSSNPKTLSF